MLVRLIPLCAGVGVAIMCTLLLACAYKAFPSTSGVAPSGGALEEQLALGAGVDGPREYTPEELAAQRERLAFEQAFMAAIQTLFVDWFRCGCRARCGGIQSCWAEARGAATDSNQCTSEFHH